MHRRGMSLKSVGSLQCQVKGLIGSMFGFDSAASSGPAMSDARPARWPGSGACSGLRGEFQKENKPVGKVNTGT